MTTKPLADDCFATAGDMMRHGEAIAALKSRLAVTTEPETVSLPSACGRILSSPIIAPYPVPMHTNAAVDGYAFSHANYLAELGRDWAVVGRSAAGHPYTGLHQPGSVVRILTGAVMPAGTDTVVMQEDVARSGEESPTVRLPSGIKPGVNVRLAGEDVAEDSVLFDAGHRLRPQDLAALASVGSANVACYRRLKVAIISSGDEIKPAGSGDLRLGDVYDANAPMLRALAESADVEVCDLGILEDNAEVVRDTLQFAAGKFDVILTTGGASQGEEDHMAAAIASLGSRHFWQLAVKPGRPMMFGQIGSTVVVGLPGNPVAVFVCFLMYVRPMLRVLGGGDWPEPRRIRLPADFEFLNRKTGRREFWRGMLVNGPEGLRVDKFKRDGSGLITGLRTADGLIEVPEDVPAVKRGDLVDFISFSEFGI
jgi:molybdopterin molybdotransferase